MNAPMLKYQVSWGSCSVIVMATSKFAAKKKARQEHQIPPAEHLTITELVQA